MHERRRRKLASRGVETVLKESEMMMKSESTHSSRINMDQIVFEIEILR
jgi:hypothetical protein